MKRLKTALIGAQSLNIGALVIINILLMTLQQPHLEDKVVDHGNEIEEISFFFNVINFIVLTVALATVDYQLLRRLK